MPTRTTNPSTCSARCFRASARSLTSIFTSVLALLSTLPVVTSQAFPKNGQFFTKGLAISDAPAPGSPQHAGSNLVIAVDLSGDGKIPQSAFIPGSGASSGYDSLQIYLVSSQTGVNYTVSSGTGFLTQEQGSTVKHLNWPIPTCIPPGTYNLTYYEGSHINKQAFYSITPLSVTVDNPNPNKDTSQCTSVANPVQPQPQTDSAPSINPYLDPNSGLADPNLSTSGEIYTITVGSSGLPSQWTIEPSGSTVTDTTGPVTTATIVVISSETLTETITSPSVSLITTTTLATSTVTAIMAPSDVGAGGFLPVNGALGIGHSVSTILVLLSAYLPLMVLLF